MSYSFTVSRCESKDALCSEISLLYVLLHVITLYVLVSSALILSFHKLNGKIFSFVNDKKRVNYMSI